MDQCGGFSPLMTYLQVLFGVGEGFDRSAEFLSEVVGFKVSATAAQNNTEATGARIDGHPLRMIPAKRTEECELMVVEMDGRMSPQIHEEQTISGREALKQLTEYKECNLVIIDKYRQSELVDRWMGACYGPRDRFEQYVGHTGLQMGQLSAQQIIVLADGAKSNWEIQQTDLSDAVPILDFFHACEQLGGSASYTQRRNRARKPSPAGKICYGKEKPYRSLPR